MWPCLAPWLSKVCEPIADLCTRSFVVHPENSDPRFLKSSSGEGGGFGSPGGCGGCTEFRSQAWILSSERIHIYICVVEKLHEERC